MIKHYKQTRTARAAFTIVEIIITIVIIGILASIVIANYNGAQERARATAALSDAKDMSEQLAIYKIKNGSYPASVNGYEKSEGTSYQYSYNAATKSYCLTVTNGKKSYKVSPDTPAPVVGGCPGHGQDGQPPITNLAINPSVETDGTSWRARWFGSGGAGTTTRTSLAARFGNYGYRKTWTVAGGGQDIGFDYNQPVTGGKTYTFSAYTRGSIATQNRPHVEWYDAGNTKIVTNVGQVISTPINTWQRVSITATAPSNAVRGLFVWGPYPPSGSPTAVVGQTLDFDGVMITEGATLYNYADGSSTNWVWNGTPNGSTSTGPAL